MSMAKNRLVFIVVVNKSIYEVVGQEVLVRW